MAGYCGRPCPHYDTVQEKDGINCRPGAPQAMHNTYRACAPPIIRPHPLFFFAEFHKKGPTGSEKQVINLVWPNKYGY